MKNYQKNQAGFSLTELVVGLAIAGIVVAIGAPKFSETVKEARFSANINELQSTMHRMQALAAQRNEVISMCRSNASGACDIDDGLYITMFIDTNENGLVTSGEEVISTNRWLSDNETFRILKGALGSQSHVDVINAFPSGNIYVTDLDSMRGTTRDGSFYSTPHVINGEDYTGGVSLVQLCNSDSVENLRWMRVSAGGYLEVIYAPNAKGNCSLAPIGGGDGDGRLGGGGGGGGGGR